MRKIPTIFQRDRRWPFHVNDVPHPDCDWVFRGEGVPLRKYDGACMMRNAAGQWYARRVLRGGEVSPKGFKPIQLGVKSSEIVGWEPVENSSFARYHSGASVLYHESGNPAGTYELVVSKINGNLDGMPSHWLVKHSLAPVLPLSGRSFREIRDAVLEYHRENGIEGIVFHHPDGRMAKIKARDFL